MVIQRSIFFSSFILHHPTSKWLSNLTLIKITRGDLKIQVLIVGNFNAAFILMDGSSRLKINKETIVLKDN